MIEHGAQPLPEQSISHVLVEHVPANCRGVEEAQSLAMVTATD
jgi:hypothetical protein